MPPARRPWPTTGPPLALPVLLDRLSERWWRLSPRWRAAVVMIGIVAVLAVAGRGAARSPWGPPVPVLVTAVDVPAGAPVVDVRTADRPADLVPPDALTAPPDDARARGPIPSGTVLTERHVASGVAGLVGPGEVAVSLPRDGLPPVEAGQAVDVLATRPDGSGSRVAEAARVLAVDDAWVWLAVRTEQADAVAGAAGTGQLRLAVRPP